MRRLAFTLALTTLAATIATGPAVGETIQQEEGRLLAAAPLVGVSFEDPVRALAPYDGVNLAIVALDPAAGGASFELEAVDGIDPEAEGHGDLDVCFYDENQALLGCSASPGGESGTVPEGAAEAGIFLYRGIDVQYRVAISAP